MSSDPTLTNTQTLQPLPRTQLQNTVASRERVIQQIQAAGVCGLGGGRFDTANKLRAAAGARAVIINGLQSEPDNNSDMALLQETPKTIIAGAALAAFCVCAGSTADADAAMSIVLALPEKPALVSELARTLQTSIEQESAWITNLLDRPVEFRRVQLKAGHASGEEHVLAISLGLSKEAPTDGAPIANSAPLTTGGLVCINVATAHALARAVFAGEPLRQRLITIHGKPQWLDFGTPLQTLLTPEQTLASIWVNGRHGGMPASDQPDNAQVHAGLFCINTAPAQPTAPCINCSACVPACPVGLRPDELYRALEQNTETAPHLQLDACLECGACNAVCPSNLPLAQVFRRARTEQAAAMTRARMAQKAKTRSAARSARLAAQGADRAARAKERQRRQERSKRSW